jgi:hypothetical protein
MIASLAPLVVGFMIGEKVIGTQTELSILASTDHCPTADVFTLEITIQT